MGYDPTGARPRIHADITLIDGFIEPGVIIPFHTIEDALEVLPANRKTDQVLMAERRAYTPTGEYFWDGEPNSPTAKLVPKVTIGHTIIPIPWNDIDKIEAAS
jgi:hypothetical protein